MLKEEHIFYPLPINQAMQLNADIYLLNQVFFLMPPVKYKNTKIALKVKGQGHQNLINFIKRQHVIKSSYVSCFSAIVRIRTD